ncbi:hypothetical protein A3K69_02850 [Candidatus Bathyarchaeota archaeon RBG_16_57_9]|nr:MAG: hypothetical protein A3K69_02850 [Candidatus Bathyarchaeota archaeon RBG_16_57_9]
MKRFQGRPRVVKVRVLVEGSKVQEIGYRIFLLEKALENGVGNIYSRNVDRDKVELLVDDEEERLERFYHVVLNERPEGSSVDTIKREPYSGNMLIPPIDRYFQFLTLEQMSRGREEIVKLPGFIGAYLEKVAVALGGIDYKFGEVIERFGLFGEQAKGMNLKLEKVDSTLGGMDEKLSGMNDKLEKVDSKLGGMDKKLGGIDSNIEKLSTLPDKIDLLPGRIAEAIFSKEKKS